MNNQINLPRLVDILYKEKDALGILDMLRKKIAELPCDFFYAVPLDMKFEELQNLIRYTDSEQPFVYRMKSTWSSDIRKKLIKKKIMFDMTLRRKSIYSTLSKMNRIMAEGKSMDNGIHDLMGVEVIVYTNGETDTQKDIEQCYCTMNLILEYFLSRRDDRFFLCDSSGVKDAVPCIDSNGKPLSPDDKQKLIQVQNTRLLIPEFSGISPQFKNYVKDYTFQPKIESFYGGLQSSVCYVDETGRIYFEIQVKTQNQRECLDSEFTPDGKKNPGNHHLFRKKQIKNNEKMINEKIPQFDLDLNELDLSKCNIGGLRKEYDNDRSSIIAPKSWSICNSTHTE